MAKKSEPKETKAKEVEIKKYIAKSVLVGYGKTIHVGEEIELTETQAKRLIELDAIEE